ncbi:hypothetical protein [Brachymonas denitrificans]|uniref:hypothetical protein n=1 Tax=Brachymonas denitrificans TaxID=28220 RepID=UPI001BCDD95E|nr:hypothetical protein [Brachymonas denitrificans]
MQVQITDFQGAGAAIAGPYAAQWQELEQVLLNMPLHLKASDQDGKQGSPIFDPVGTNEYIAAALTPLGWGGGIPIPPAFSFLGTDIDFGKNGLLAEIQFSNYPFLLNNTIRSQLFFNAGTVFHGAPTGLVVIVTKAGMFPSSNSTLYYEQAVNQLNALAQNGVFTVPIRLVGLFESVGQVNATWTDYAAARYSRTVAARYQRAVTITQGRAGRCKIV